MKRIQDVGMNCGCEYTDFPRFRGLKAYSRYTHSVHCAEIVWKHTNDPVQTLAALYHDISSPVFAHSIDFLKGDYLRQETTESDTQSVILASSEIAALCEKNGIERESILDYHRYPIADNDAPRLSSDRLEYSIGNMVNYGFRTEEEAERLYKSVFVSVNEEGKQELCFSSKEAAENFADAALCCSRVYVSPEDRYAMQRLAEVLAFALRKQVVTECDFMGTEREIIGKLMRDSVCAEHWVRFRGLHEMLPPDRQIPEYTRVIFAKKRCIDPYVPGCGRVSAYSESFARKLNEFLEESQGDPLCAE